MSRLNCIDIEFAHRRINEISGSDNGFEFYCNEALCDLKEIESDYNLSPEIPMPLLNSTFVLPEGLYFTKLLEMFSEMVKIFS